MNWQWWKSKTVLTALFAMLLAWVFVLTGVDLGSGPVTVMQALSLTIAAITAIFMRNGIEKNGPAAVLSALNTAPKKGP